MHLPDLKSLHVLFAEYNDAFIIHDSNRKGYLTKKEVTKSMKNLGFNPTEVDCQNIELEIVYKSKYLSQLIFLKFHNLNFHSYVDWYACFQIHFTYLAFSTFHHL